MKETIGGPQILKQFLSLLTPSLDPSLVHICPNRKLVENVL